MSQTVLALVTALIASFATIKVFKPIATRVGLVDSPNSRKVHTGNVPLIGGIAVFIGVLTSTSIMYPQSTILNLYLISSGLIVFVGALDDYKDLSVGARITAQTLIAAIMVYGAGVHLSSVGDLLGFGVVSLVWFGYPVTVLATIASINAFNMSDGIDGLAGTLSLISFLAIGSLLYLANSEYFLLPILLAAAILPFLAFNLGILGGNGKKIFMGDAGSMFVGLSVVWLLVLGSQGDSFAFRPVTALWIIAIPLMDMCAITIRRIAQGRSPFLPDREHLHHIFIRMGFSSKMALVAISLCAIFLAAVGVVGELLKIDESIMFALFLTVFLCYYYTLKHVWKVTRFIKSRTIKTKKSGSNRS